MESDEPPQTLSPEQVGRILGAASKRAVLVLIGERIYANEGEMWRLLDNRTYSTVKEMTDGARS